MSLRTALLVINAKSRQGAERAEEAASALQAQGLVVAVADCSAAGDLAGLIAARGREADLVVVGGGDGTLNAAALGIIEAGRPLGILPLGTANDLARTLDIQADLQAAVGIIGAGKTRRIDLGLVNDKPFFNVASIGLSAALAETLTPGLKRRFGKIGYGIAALKVAARAEPFRAQIVSSAGSVRVWTFQIAVGNGRFYGGGNAVEKDAAIDDARLDLYSLEFKRLWGMALMLPAFRRGEHVAWEAVRAMADRDFEVITASPRPVNADGELITETPARFTVRPRAIEVFCP